MKLRTIACILLITIAVIVAGAKVANCQTVNNPTAIEFSSVSHTGPVATYKVCFYTSATAHAAFRCNDVPKASAVFVVGTTYRLPRASWQTGLASNTSYWFKVAAVDGSGVASVEVAPDTAPFSFSLAAAPAPVTAVTLVP